MNERQDKRLTDRELHTFFDRLFPHGFAGGDVLAEIAPEGWEHSRLLACFHPSAEQLFEERVAIHRNLEELRRLRRRREGAATLEPRPEPTLEDVRREYEPSPVHQEEEVTELVGLCLWDTFSDNHDVIAADGRIADIGSFRGAGTFLDEYLTRDQGELGPRRLHAVLHGNDLDLPTRRPDARVRDDLPASQSGGRRLGGPLPGNRDRRARARGRRGQSGRSYSVSQAAVAELGAQKRRAEVEQFRVQLREANARAREEAIDHPPPATVSAYRQVYGRDPRGWLPA